MSVKKVTKNRMSFTERQRQLLEVALNAFSRRGFKGTTTKEIAAAAGVAEAVIFQHFDSKDSLYSAVLDLRLDSSEEQNWLDEINDCMDRNDDEGLFRAFAEHILHSYSNDPSLERVILFSALEGHQQGLARLKQQASPTFHRMFAYIARRQRKGALRKMNPHAVMITIAGMAHHYGLLTQIIQAPIPKSSHKEMARLFTRILMDGIKGNTSVKKKPARKKTPAKTHYRKAKK